MDIEREIIDRFIAESIMKALSDNPADEYKADQQNTTEKMAWIELHEDVLDEAYDMSQEYREYE